MTNRRTYRYIRVIEDSVKSSHDDIQVVVDSLLRANTQVSTCKPIEQHQRGGFSIFLDFPDSEIESVFDYLRENGWLPCI